MISYIVESETGTGFYQPELNGLYERYHLDQQHINIENTPTNENSVQKRSQLKDQTKVIEVQQAKDLTSLRTSQRVSEPEQKRCSQDLRKKLIKDTCEWGKTKDLVDYEEWKVKQNTTFGMLLVDDIHKVIYCELPKAACTSWKVFFANLSGKVDPKDYGNLHRLVHFTDYYPTVGFRYLSSYTYEETLYRLDNYYKFMVLRNPFTRLVSAYENKFVPNIQRTRWYQQYIGSQIIRKYRRNPSEESLRDGRGVLFEELVKFLVDGNDPSISRHDNHWWKIHEICYPCLVKYDYIAKVETLDQDLPSILESIAPGNTLPFPHLNSNSYSSSYYENLSKADLDNIQRFYEIDSHMFGYNLSHYDLEC